MLLMSFLSVVIYYLAMFAMQSINRDVHISFDYYNNCKFVFVESFHSSLSSLHCIYIYLYIFIHMYEIDKLMKFILTFTNT